MARTALGGQLTEAHRAAQLALRAGTLRNLVTLWQTVDPVNLGGTINVFAEPAAVIAGQGAERSAGLAVNYFSLFRRAEGVPGPAPSLRLPPAPSAEYLAGQVRGAGIIGIRDARRAGQSVTLAKRTALTRVVGTVAKLVLTGGRNMLVLATQADRQALGFTRVTSGDACAFCRMIAGRGPVYKTEKSADFDAHGSCACAAEPFYRGDAPSAQATEYARQWRAAQTQARETDSASSGTANDALNNYRRYLAGGPDGGNAGANDGTPG